MTGPPQRSPRDVRREQPPCRLAIASLRFSFDKGHTMTTPRNPRRKLGASGPEVFPMALGCMGMSGMYGPSDNAESIATIHAALDAGVNLLDTGDFYGMGHNEMLIGRALESRRDGVLLSVKFGAQRGPGRRMAGIRCPSGGGEDRPCLLAQAAGGGPRGHLPACAARPQGAHRGDHRGHSRTDRGGVCALYRALGGGCRNYPAGSGRAPHCGPADRVFPGEPCCPRRESFLY